MNEPQTPPRPSRSLAEWQGVAAILALREDRRLRRLEMLKRAPRSTVRQPLCVWRRHPIQVT
jgi:hypothetical protein